MSSIYLARREFLVLTSLSTLAAATIGPAAFAADAKSRIAIGVAPFDANGQVHAAARIATRDGAFLSRGARVTIVGARGVAATPSARRIVEVAANFSYFDGAAKRIAPFRAWASNRVNGAEGGRTSFSMPVDLEQRVDLAITIESSFDSMTLPVVLSLQEGKLALVRGTYIFVPLFERERAPDWPSYAMQNGTLVDRDGSPATFEHFIVAIDFAD